MDNGESLGQRLPEGICCGVCHFYKPNKDKHGEEGGCQFNPPQVFPFMGGNPLSGPKPLFISCSPTVMAVSFCSKFEKRK